MLVHGGLHVHAERVVCAEQHGGAVHLGLHVVCHDKEHVGSCGQAQRVIVAPVHPERAPCDVHRYLRGPQARCRSGALCTQSRGLSQTYVNHQTMETPVSMRGWPCARAARHLGSCKALPEGGGRLRHQGSVRTRQRGARGSGVLQVEVHAVRVVCSGLIQPRLYLRVNRHHTQCVHGLT